MKASYAAWEKQFPNATDAEKAHVKEMYKESNKEAAATPTPTVKAEEKK